LKGKKLDEVLSRGWGGKAGRGEKCIYRAWRLVVYCYA